MPQQSSTLNTDQNNKLTSSFYADDGSGSSRWWMWIRSYVLGERSDSAVTSPSSSGSVIALLKGVLSRGDRQLSNSTSTALEATRVVKASAGTLFGLTGHVDTAGYVWVCNKASAPSGSSDNLLFPVKVSAAGPFSVDLGRFGRYCSTGIAVGFSSSATTWSSGGSNMWVDAQYE